MQTLASQLLMHIQLGVTGLAGRRQYYPSRRYS